MNISYVYLITTLVGIGVVSHDQTHDYICNKKKPPTEIKTINYLISIQITFHYQMNHKTNSIFRMSLELVIKDSGLALSFKYPDLFTKFSVSFLDSADRKLMILTLLF